MLEKIKEYYNNEYWTEKMVLDAVIKGKINLNDVIDIPFDLESIQQCKLLEINTSCQTAIYNGINIGENHFSLTEHDQTEILGLLAQVKDGTLPVVPYHADGELCKLWSIEEFIQIAQKAQEHIFYHRTYCNHLRAFIKRLTDKEELINVYYGTELPEDLQENMMMLLGG